MKDKVTLENKKIEIQNIIDEIFSENYNNVANTINLLESNKPINKLWNSIACRIKKLVL